MSELNGTGSVATAESVLQESDHAPDAGLFPPEEHAPSSKAQADQDAVQAQAVGKASSKPRKQSIKRSFPASSYEEALELPKYIQLHASGQKVLRLRLFELIGKSPDSGASRQLVTNSNKYGLTSGSYTNDYLELTNDGSVATADGVPERERTRTHFKLAIEQIPPFKFLYDKYINARLPDKRIMADSLIESGSSKEEVSECVDTFLLNAKFVGVLRNIAGTERFIALEHALDAMPSSKEYPLERGNIVVNTAKPPLIGSDQPINRQFPDPLPTSENWEKVCFYITPIGEDGSETRKHANLFLGSIVEPALAEFDLSVVRADQIGETGMIGKQVIDHVINARIVIVDLSFHNPNVFYELALRHATGKPTIHVMRAADRIPFDINQVRTIIIDTSDIYSLVPQLEVYKSAISNQVRRALESSGVSDNPVTSFSSAVLSRLAP